MRQYRITRQESLESSQYLIIPALWGGILGVLLVIGHVALDVFQILPDCHLPLHPKAFHNGDPFVHVLSEFVIFGGGGALVFGLSAEIRARLKRD